MGGKYLVPRSKETLLVPVGAGTLPAEPPPKESSSLWPEGSLREAKTELCAEKEFKSVLGSLGQRFAGAA